MLIPADGNLTITMLPCWIEAFPISATSFVSASSHLLDLSDMIRHLTLGQKWLVLEKNIIVLLPTFTLSWLNVVSIKLNKFSSLEPFFKKLTMSAGSFISGLFNIHCWLESCNLFSAFFIHLFFKGIANNIYVSNCLLIELNILHGKSKIVTNLSVLFSHKEQSLKSIYS